MAGDDLNLKQKDKQTERQICRQTGGESQPPADLGSFRAQQIRWDYLSLIPCKVDSTFIDSCTACHSFGSSVKNQPRGGGGDTNSKTTGATNPNQGFKTVKSQEAIYFYRSWQKLCIKNIPTECVMLRSRHVGTLISNYNSNLGLF